MNSQKIFDFIIWGSFIVQFNAIFAGKFCLIQDFPAFFSSKGAFSEIFALARFFYCRKFSVVFAAD